MIPIAILDNCTRVLPSPAEYGLGDTYVVPVITVEPAVKPPYIDVSMRNGAKVIFRVVRLVDGRLDWALVEWSL